MNTPPHPDELIGDLDNWSHEVKPRPAPLVPDDQKALAQSATGRTKIHVSQPTHKGPRRILSVSVPPNKARL